MGKGIRKLIINPPEIWDAIESQMERDEETNRSKWMADCCILCMDADLRDELPERKTAGGK